jgi:hypothetical protein
MIALVVLVAGVPNLTLRICRDRLVEEIDWVTFSCWLYIVLHTNEHQTKASQEQSNELTFRTRDSTDAMEEAALRPLAC